MNGYGVEGRSLDVLDLLSRTALTQHQCCEELGLSKAQFRSALNHLRENICPQLDVTIPHPVPDDGFKYHVTGEWLPADGSPAIQAGTNYALGLIERRLLTIMRDVNVAMSNLEHNTWDYRKVKFMGKKLTDMFSTLGKMAAAEDRKRVAS